MPRRSIVSRFDVARRSVTSRTYHRCRPNGETRSIEWLGPPARADIELERCDVGGTRRLRKPTVARAPERVAYPQDLSPDQQLAFAGALRTDRPPVQAVSAHATSCGESTPRCQGGTPPVHTTPPFAAVLHVALPGLRAPDPCVEVLGCARPGNRTIRFAGNSSPLTDSNRRPPPYHGGSGGSHAYTRVQSRHSLPANRAKRGVMDASRDVVRVVSDVSVLCPWAVDDADNAERCELVPDDRRVARCGVVGLGARARCSRIP
jgi:hypothetical protein